MAPVSFETLRAALRVQLKNDIVLRTGWLITLLSKEPISLFGINDGANPFYSTIPPLEQGECVLVLAGQEEQHTQQTGVVVTLRNGMIVRMFPSYGNVFLVVDENGSRRTDVEIM